MGEMVDAVVCGWKSSNYTTKGPPGWAQQNSDNYVCQCGFFFLISFRGSGLWVNNLSLLSGDPGSERQRQGVIWAPCKAQGDIHTWKDLDNGKCLTTNDTSAPRCTSIISVRGGFKECSQNVVKHWVAFPFPTCSPCFCFQTIWDELKPAFSSQALFLI